MRCLLIMTPYAITQALGALALFLPGVRSHDEIR